MNRFGTDLRQIGLQVGRCNEAILLLRTLGQPFLMKGDAPAALPQLRAAATVATDDPINLFTYAHCLLAIEGESHQAEADELFQRALRLGPLQVSWPSRSRISSAVSPIG
jgi:hypothetical protein